LSNGIFKDKTRMHPRASKVRQNGYKRHTAIPSLEKRKQSRRHGGFGGLSPPNKTPSPLKLKYETL